MDITILTHAVECQYPGRPFFEVIAAFNCKPAATAYKDECVKANKPQGFLYRVRKIKGGK